MKNPKDTPSLTPLEARRRAMKKFREEIRIEYSKITIADMQAAFRLMAEGFRPGISPRDIPNAANWTPIVPEEDRPYLE